MMTRSVLLLGLCGAMAGCPSSSTTGDGSSSSSGSSGTGGSSSRGTASSGQSSTGGPRSCGSDICMFSEVCVLTTDGGVCTPSCLSDGGCAAGLICRGLGADGGIRACLPGGGVGDPCGGSQACLDGLLCAAPVDAGASCRQPCAVVVEDAGTLECPSGYVCFPTVDDGGPGACFPR